MGEKLDQFRSERERLNELVFAADDKHLKRFFTLDNAVYRDGVLPGKTKEMMGLVASMVLRCDDCINYHVDQCFSAGLSKQEFEEILSIALVVGGSIVIPHLRRAYALWDELEKERANKSV